MAAEEITAQGWAGSGLILGLESSCDETSAAVVRAGREALSNVVASQIAIHAPFGGVVPEIASREHLRAIVPVVEQAIDQAGVALSDLDAIAVTEGPGLPGALLVGVSYAKALAFALGKPLIAVNHLEGHIHAVLLERASARDENAARATEDTGEDTEASQPKLALVVSGGHTHLYLAQMIGSSWSYRNIGRTVDDAAGEAFDKVAKLLGLGYPGGPWIDALAPFGDPKAVHFSFSQIKAKAHRQHDPAALDPHEATYFSFSGIKTAVLRYVETHAMQERIAARRAAIAALPELNPRRDLEAMRALCDRETLDLIASFQHAVVEDLCRKSFRAAEDLGVEEILVSGGVAANRELRERFRASGDKAGLAVLFPSLRLATDNAAMIAAAAWPKLLAGEFADDLLAAKAGLKLGA